MPLTTNTEMADAVVPTQPQTKAQTKPNEAQPQPQPEATTQQPPEKGEEDDENDDEKPIPPLTSIAPTIFVPITTDLTAPFTPPPTRPDRLRAIIASQEAHSSQVRSNLCSLFEQESARVMQLSRTQEPLFLSERGLSAAEYDQALQQNQSNNKDSNSNSNSNSNNPHQQQPVRGWRATPADIDGMISNMSAQQPAGMRKAGSIVDVPTPDLATLPAGNTPRELATRECLTLLSKGMDELKGYDAHVRRKRVFYEHALKRELEREAE